METQTSGQYFKGLSVIHLAMIAGQVVFATIVILLLQNDLPRLIEDVTMRKTFLYIVTAFVIIGIITSQFMFNRQREKAKQSENLTEKMSIYRSAMIVRYALLQGPSLFAIVAFLLFGEFLFLGYSILLILSMLMQRPTSKRAELELSLNRSEADILNNPDSDLA